MDLFSVASWLVSRFSGTNVTEGIERERQTGRGTAGITVNERTALNCSNVYACVRVISETFATMPWPVYQSIRPRGKERSPDHPVNYLLNVSPDGVINADQWAETKMSHLLIGGNAYSEIEFYKGGEAKGIHLLNPTEIRVERTKSGAVQYLQRGNPTPIPADRMLHWAGLGYDGLVGYSPVRLAARSIGLSLATEAFGAAWFENGSRPGGFLIHPKKLSPQATKTLREGIDDIHGGPEKYGKWMVLQEGMDAKGFAVPPEEAQYLGTRLFQLQECARWYRLDPAMVGDHSQSTFSNVEQQSINFVTHTMRPWCERIENETNRKLFAKDDPHFSEHVIEGLLRGDLATRYAAYAIARQWGWKSVNDIRELENDNPIENGDIYLTPANMADVSKIGQTDPASNPANPQAPAQDPAPPEAKPSADAVSASLACVQDSIDRMLRREAEAVRHAATKPKEFLKSVEKFYEGQKDIVSKATAPSINAFSALTGKSCQFSTMQELLGGEKELLELSGQVTAAELPQAVERWIENRSKRSVEIITALAI